MRFDLRSRSIELGDELVAYAERRATTSFERIAENVKRVLVTVEEVLSPDGSPETACVVRVFRDPKPSIVIQDRDPEIRVLLLRALGRAARAVQKARTRELRLRHMGLVASAASLVLAVAVGSAACGITPFREELARLGLVGDPPEKKGPSLSLLRRPVHPPHR